MAKSFMERMRSPMARRIQKVLMLLIALSMVIGYVI